VSAGDLARLSAGGARRETAKVAISALAPERFLVAIQGDAPTLLVTTQKRFPPYWRAFLDGREVEAFTADGLFLGVDVPAGRHTVEGRFVIPRIELLISALGGLALLTVMIAAKTRRP
jgi:hypothetical protein